MLYESLLVAAILIVAGFAFGAATHKLEGGAQWVFRFYLLTVLGAYFVLCWARGGRTLAMKAWRLRLHGADGARIGWSRAALRFLLALAMLGTTLVGLLLMRDRPQDWRVWLLLLPGLFSVLWALWDRDRQFLHDRLAGTRIALLR